MVGRGGDTGLVAVWCYEEWGLQFALWVEREAAGWYARQDTQMPDFFVIIYDVGAFGGW